MNTASPESPSDKERRNYSDAWQAYRRHRSQAIRIYLWVILILTITFGISYLVCSSCRANHEDSLFPLVAMLVLIVAAFVEFPRLFWRCPRCGQPFFVRLLGMNWPEEFISECRHCGLPKWAESDPSRGEWAKERERRKRRPYPWA